VLRIGYFLVIEMWVARSVFKSRFPFLRLVSWAEVRDGGLLCTVRYCILWLFFYPYLAALWIRQFERELLQESRSFCGRIGVVRGGMRYVEVGQGWEMSPSGHLVVCTRTRARTNDIQRMLSSRPWASLVDLHLFLEGWDKGEKWASPKHSLDSCSLRLGTSSPQVTDSS